MSILKNNLKYFTERFLDTYRFGAIGDEGMGKTFRLQSDAAQMKAEAKEGYFEIYIDIMGDTPRYKYYDDYTRITDLREIKDKPDNAYILDLSASGSVINYIERSADYTKILLGCLLVFEKVKENYPRVKNILFTNDSNIFFPNIGSFNTKEYRPQEFVLNAGKHINLNLFWSTPDTRNVSQQLIARTDVLKAFRCSDTYVLDKLSKMKDIGLRQELITQLPKLQQREFLYIKNNQKGGDN